MLTNEIGSARTLAHTLASTLINTHTGTCCMYIRTLTHTFKNKHAFVCKHTTMHVNVRSCKHSRKYI